MEKIFNGQAFRLEMDGHVGVLTFDYPGERVNKWSELSIAEFGQVMEQLKRDAKGIKCLLFRSAKPGSYIVGADLDLISTMKDKSLALKASQEGQRVFTMLEDLGIPSIAAIEGPCMGGGTEVSLCATYRMASDSPKTVIAVPEIKLGFIPGWGGTYRLPKMLGLATGLDMILTGKNIRADKAGKIGLVDLVVPEAMFADQSLRIAHDVAAGKPFPRKPKKNVPIWQQDPTKYLEKTLIGRRYMFSEAKKTVMKQTRGNYPAPLRALEVLEKNWGKGRESFLKAEAEAFADLWATPESKNLVGLFFLNELAKKDTGTSLDAKQVKALAPIHELAVLGAGVMGGGIASVSAGKGLRALVKDLTWDAVSKALAHAQKLCDDDFKKKRITRPEKDAWMSRIRGQLDYSGFGAVDLVIEAVVENMDVKKKVFAEVETKVKPDCIIASNTSSLRVTEMATAMKDPSRLIGLHFFNPVHKMPLVEIISHAGSSEEAVARGVAYVKAIGKTPVVVKDGPGFLVNRILMPWLNEAGYCLKEGYSIERMDEVLKQFGMPMGPCELLDEIGLDVAAKVAHILHKDLGERSASSDAIDRILETSKDKDGKITRLGRKGGLGLYVWDKAGGRRVEPDQQFIDEALFRGAKPKMPEHTPESLVRRQIYPMINEAAAILAEGLVASPSHVDLGMIFGTGFPPFRGGLLRYADSIGLDKIVAELDRLSEQHGPRLAPSPALRELAKGRGKFYS